MAVVLVEVTPPGGDPIDITNDSVFARCSFEQQMNGVPGSFDWYVRDPTLSYSFATGWEWLVRVDDVSLGGGYITRVGMTSFAPAADTSDLGNYELALWHLVGVDYNIALDRRVFRRTSDYLTNIRINETWDGAILREAIDSYTDMGEFDTSGIDDVSEIPDIDHVTIQQGWPVRKEFEALLPFSGAVYYIGPDRSIVWKAYEDAEKRWGFSDNPNHAPITTSPSGFQDATYGFSNVEAVEDATYMANDVMIWGGSEFAGSGGTVFHRSQDATSIADHNRWQYAETHFGERGYRGNAGVTAAADAILNGPPGATAEGAQKGLKYPQWEFRFSWHSDQVPLLDGDPDHIRAGDLVTIELTVFGVTKLLPVRTLRVSFPDAFDGDPLADDRLVKFEGTFGLQLSDSYTLWRYIIKNQNRTLSIPPVVTTPDSTTALYGSQFSGTPTPAPDNAETVFSIPFGYIPGTLLVWKNGLLLSRGTAYVESDNEAGEFTMTSAPLSTDELFVFCTTLDG